jgi:DNA-binding CsgD family transcriptional regulator
LRGAFDDARRALDHVLDKLAGASEAQFTGPLSAARMDLALWLHDIPAARAVVDDSMPILERTEDLGALAWLYSRALRTEAEAFERARAARDEAAAAEAVRRGAGFASRLDRLDDDTLAPGYRAHLSVGILLGRAEATRLAGEPSAEAWAAAIDAADARPVAYEAAYARFMLGEAILAARGPREAASAALAEARERAAALQAMPLLAAIEGLAARARLPLGDARGASEDAAERGGVAAYDLTAREVEVLRLVAAGRTNRQIGEELFISESTAGVHVSRILAKFGVAGRVEAATIAARLGLTE